MLIEFRVTNHRSIRDEQALSMKASARSDGDSRLRSIDCYPDPLLPVAAIYGANASGKSNVLSALAFMREAVVFSQRTWPPDEGVPRDPFAWGPCRENPSVFEAEFVHAGQRFRYGFAATDKAIVEEWLDAWPEGHKQSWFHRTAEGFKPSAVLKGESNKIIREATRNNALFLSTAVQLQHKQLLPVYNWFREMDAVFKGLTRSVRIRGPQFFREHTLTQLIESQTSENPQRRLFDDEDENKLFNRFRELMRSADLGIVDFRTKSDPDEERGTRGLRVQLKHQSDEEDAWLPLEEESRGTRTLFQIALPILRAIDSGSVLLIDEIEANLHPNIAEAIVGQFNDPRTNPKNAQLIFTTHDTNLLGTMRGEPVVRRDEVWLTEKNPQGGTELYALTDFQPRKAENLERGYLQGRYSAIPFHDKFSIGPES